MSAAKHTPGPWKWDGASRIDAVAFLKPSRFVDNDGVEQVFMHGMVALPYSCGGNDTHEANALVMAAAPELLEALRDCGEWFGLTKPPLDQWEDLAEDFHKETGFMRPGKDYPMGAGLDEEREAERSAKWKEWSEKRRDDMIARVRAAIAKATGVAS